MAAGDCGFTFPVGYRTFHKKQRDSFQLNRPYSLGYARAEGLEEAGKRIRGFDDWKAEMVRQDVLVFAFREDHLVPFRLHREGLKRLNSARSVTGRVFTRQEHAQNHCQIGNMGLALEVMRGWIEGSAGAVGPLQSGAR